MTSIQLACYHPPPYRISGHLANTSHLAHKADMRYSTHTEVLGLSYSRRAAEQQGMMQRGPDDNSSRIYPVGTANARIMGVAKGNLSERPPRLHLEGSNPETEKLSEAQGTCS